MFKNNNIIKPKKGSIGNINLFINFKYIIFLSWFLILSKNRFIYKIY